MASGQERAVSQEKAVIVMTVLIDVIGFGIVIPVLPYFAQSFGAGPTTISLLFSSFAFFSFLSSPYFGALSDRIGRRPVLLGSILMTAVGWFIVAGGTALWMVFLGRIVDGLSAGKLTTAQTYLVDIARDDKERTANLGLVGAAFGIGFLLGPVIGGLLSTMSPVFPFYCTAILAVVNTVLAYFFLPETLKQKRHDRMTFNPLKPVITAATTPAIRFDMLAWVFFGLAFVMTTAMFSLYVQDQFGYTNLATGLLFTVIGVVGFTNQTFLLRQFWSRRYTDGQLQTMMPLVLVVGLALLATGVLWMFIVGLALLGLGQGVFRVVLTSIVAGKAPGHMKGEVIGVISGVFSACSVVAPVIAGPMYQVSHHLPYIVGSVLMLVAFFASQRSAKTEEAWLPRP
jgi:MFS family permease